MKEIGYGSFFAVCRKIAHTKNGSCLFLKMPPWPWNYLSDIGVTHELVASFTPRPARLCNMLTPPQPWSFSLRSSTLVLLALSKICCRSRATTLWAILQLIPAPVEDAHFCILTKRRPDNVLPLLGMHQVLFPSHGSYALAILSTWLSHQSKEDDASPVERGWCIKIFWSDLHFFDHKIVTAKRM